MSYAAKLDEQKIVETVIVGDYVWANDNLGGTWVNATDDDGEQIANIGLMYDETTQQFIQPPKPTPIPLEPEPVEP